MKASAKDLRVRASELLKTVARGEEVVILYHGKPCAKMVPVSADGGAEYLPPQKAGKQRPKAIGMWKNRKDMKNPTAYVRSLREDRF